MQRWERNVKLAHMLYYNGEYAGFFNIGSTSLVKDRTNDDGTFGEVYESSGLFIADKFLDDDVVFQALVDAVRELLETCSAGTEYTNR
eukprot:UN05145